MPLVLADRVRETTTVVGTNDATLLGAVTGFQSFAVVGDTNTCYYTIADNAGNWEVGIGTYSTSGPTLARTTVLSSSNAGLKVNFPAGTKDIFVTYPSEKSINLDESGYVDAGGSPNVSINGNLTFIGTTRRITGDFSNATVANRVLLQTSTTNGNTRFGLIPNGTSVISAFDAHSTADPTNSSRMGVAVIGGSESRITSDALGSGTYLPLTMYTGGSERMRIDTAGFVGIGTNSPQTKLQLDYTGSNAAAATGLGAFQINQSGVTALSGTAGIEFKCSTFGSGYGTKLSAFDDGSLIIGNRANSATWSERMRIDSAGNVGIGMIPVYQLDITTTAGNGIRLNASSGQANIFMQQGGVTNGFLNAAGGGGTDLGVYANRFLTLRGTDAVIFYSNQTTERMRITSGGNVGIGTSAPTGSLNIGTNGSATATPTALLAYNGTGLGGTTDNMAYISEFGGSVSNNARLLFALRRTATGTDWLTSAWRIQPAVDTSFTGAGSNRGYLELAIGPNGPYTGVGLSGSGASTPDFIINGSGNVGVGTITPSGKLAVVTDANSSQWLAIRNNNAGSSATMGVLLGNDGNAAYGALLVNSSTNTTAPGGANSIVVGSYGSNHLTFVTSNTERARIDGSTGNFAIGMTATSNSANGKLNIFNTQNDGAQTIANAGLLFAQAGGFAQAGIYPIGSAGFAGSLVFTTAASKGAPDYVTTERMRIDSSGNVGIGTATPAGGIVLFRSGGQTTSAITTGTNIEPFVTIRQNSASAGAGGGVILGAQGGSFAAIKGLLTDGGSNTTGDLAFSTRNAASDAALTERMRIAAGGNVGIGNTSPFYGLSVNSATGINSYDGVSSKGRFVLGDPLDPTGYIGMYRGAIGNPSTGANALVLAGFDAVGFTTGAASFSGQTERMRITSGGAVGIGTASPTSLLDVVGTPASSGSQGVRVSDGTRVGLLQVTGSAYSYNGVGANETLFYGAGSAVSILADGTPLKLCVGTAERMRITTSGNVGIATTTPQNYLDIAVGSQTYNPTYVGHLRLPQTANVATTNNGGLEFIASAFQSGFGFRITASDETAGSTPLIFQSRVNSASWTERMRLTNDGSLLVGTTTNNGRISSAPKSSFNPGSTAGSWVNAPAISVSGSFGGGVSWIDGSGGYCAWVDDGGTDFNIAGGLTGNTVGFGVFLNGHSATSWSARSDERLKDKLEPITDALNKVCSLRAVTGVYTKYPNDKQAFLIAQDVQKVLPEAVSIADKRSPEQYLGLAYTQVIPLLVAAIKEQQSVIEDLTNRIKKLEGV